MLSSTDFWEWFKKNNSQYFFLNQIDDESERERVMDLLLEKLHQFSDQLYFLIGGHPDDTQDLIITAEGNVDYFSKVEELVNAAPALDNWNIIAFKPQAEEPFTINYNKAKIDTSKAQFIPLENKKQPELLGLRLIVDEYSIDNKQDFLNAAYEVLDTLLGEKLNALYVKHVEVTGTQQNNLQSASIPLSDLPRYIRRKFQIV